MSDTEKCGTNAGWNAHKYYGTEICDECRKAHNVYMREWRGKTGVNWRRSIRARQRALTRLGNLYIEDYRRLYAEELAKEAGR